VVERGAGYCRTCLALYQRERREARARADGASGPRPVGRPRNTAHLPLPDLTFLDDVTARHALMRSDEPDQWPAITSTYLDLDEARGERARAKQAGELDVASDGDGVEGAGAGEVLHGQVVNWEGQWTEWLATPEHDYSPARFYTRSTNQFDHSQTVQTGFPREVMALVSKIVHAGVVPEYRSNQDFIRDAVVHRLHQIATFLDDPAMDYTLTIERVQCILDQRAADIAALDRMAESIEDLAGRALTDQNWANLREVIRQAETLADQIAGPWGARMDRQVAQWRDQIPS
jgi:hypothetical protein